MFYPCFILKDMNFVYFWGKYEYESTQSTRSFLFLSIKPSRAFSLSIASPPQGLFFSGKKSPSYNESIRCDTIHNATIVVTGIVTCQEVFFEGKTPKLGIWHRCEGGVWMPTSRVPARFRKKRFLGIHFVGFFFGTIFF